MSSTQRKLPISQYISNASQLIYGGMNLGGGWKSNPITKDDEKLTQQLLETCLENGINILDLADIYTFGKAEEVVGRVLKKSPDLLDELVIQSKLGLKLTPVHPVKQYDFSAQWVSKALDDILSRLGMAKLDVLFLHRPDPLMDVKELADTLNKAYDDDKFGYLAVSNMHAGQLAYIQSNVTMPIIANQLEMSLLKADFIEDGITVNMQENCSQGFPRGTLEFCAQQNIQLQSWGSMAQGQFNDIHHDDANIAATSKLVAELAEKYQVTPNAIVLAWLMRHPANIQPVVGTLKPERIIEIAQSTKITLEREEWFKLYETRRGQELP
ncbi:aldo/keto reductase [Glaciecola sp. 1036]|uniref:aldo/keto reductase n=1 Tax=Alteromonadaceae TaxID=72275 RepID=UPI003D0157C7